MTLVGLSRIPLTPFEYFAQVLVDPRRRDRAVLLALFCYVALWTAYAVLAKGSQDLHFDMGELIAWSREPAFGYAKHPPFAAWLVKAWFSVFPLTDWAYYLLAVVNATWCSGSPGSCRGAISMARNGRQGLRCSRWCRLQFPCFEVQCQHRADPAVGSNHVVVLALVRDPQHGICGPRRARCRRCDAGQILVGHAARRARAGSTR